MAFSRHYQIRTTSIESTVRPGVRQLPSQLVSDLRQSKFLARKGSFSTPASADLPSAGKDDRNRKASPSLFLLVLYWRSHRVLPRKSSKPSFRMPRPRLPASFDGQTVSRKGFQIVANQPPANRTVPAANGASAIHRTDTDSLKAPSSTQPCYLRTAGG